MTTRTGTHDIKSRSTRARRAPGAAGHGRSAARLKLSDTGWDTIKQLLSREIDGLRFLMDIEETTVAEDTGPVILVEVRDAPRASRIAREHAGAIQRVLTLVGRPTTTVRLRVNLARPYETPDFYIRDVKAETPAKSGAV